MEHSHHHGIGQRLTSLNATYYIAIALNLGFVVVELVVGLIYNSLGLLSDAGHKFIDVFSLVIALLAFKLAGSRSTKRFTFGLRKSSVLIALLNAMVLLVAVCVIVIESIEKFQNPTPVSGAAISWTAGLGIIVSGVSALLLMNHQKRDINTRGAFLHMATDALVSIGVVISGIIISLTSWTFVDPLISIIIACIILFNTLRLLSESFKMSVDAVPSGISYDHIESVISSVDGVREVEELHIWPVSIIETALMARVVVDKASERDAVTSAVRSSLSSEGITLITIETRGE